MSAAKGRILVIDDERGIRSLCGDVLRRAGHHVEVAETGNRPPLVARDYKGVVEHG